MTVTPLKIPQPFPSGAQSAGIPFRRRDMIAASLKNRGRVRFQEWRLSAFVNNVADKCLPVGFAFLTGPSGPLTLGRFRASERTAELWAFGGSSRK